MQWLQQPEMYQGKSVAELRERIKLDFTPQGLGNQAAIDRAIEYFLKDSLSVHHPQCVAHLHCPSLVISQAAEVLINATNQSMDSWDQSPSATLIEMKLIEWLRAQVGYQPGDAGVFTSGGTQSNLMGSMLARDAFFARQGHSVQQDGLVGDLRKLKVFCSENAHFSVQKNMALMGLGYQSVTLVKTDRFARMDVNDLAEKLAQAKANGEQVMAIVATAGTTDAGAIDRCATSRGWRRNSRFGCTWMRPGRRAAAFRAVPRLPGRPGTGGLHYPGLPQAVLPDHQLRCLLAERRAPL